MPRHLWLHIGLPKTGTTSIQRALGGRRAALLRQGIAYPNSRGGAVQILLHRAALPRSRAGTGNFLPLLTAEIGALPDTVHSVILSAEQCSLALAGERQIAQLHDLLAPMFSSMHVIVYLRRQDTHAASLYGQALRRGRIEVPDLDRIATEFASMYDYNALLRSWAAVFGSASIKPRIFEPASLQGADAVVDFFAACGAQEALDGTNPARDDNPSMNVQGQALLFALGRHLQRENGKPNVNSAVWRRLNAIVTELCPGRGWQPDRRTGAAFMARYTVSNEATRAAWFPERTQLFRSDFDALPENQVDVAAGPAAETIYNVLLAAVAGAVRD